MAFPRRLYARARTVPFRRRRLVSSGAAGVPVTWFTAIGDPDTPELIVSSEDWFLLCNATVNNSGDWQQTFDDYFTERAAQGYNGVEVTMFSYPDPSAITSSGQDSDGVWPFASSSNNPSNAFNTAWTDRRDAFFTTAAAHGFRVFCNITTPYVDLGAFTASWTTTQWTNWGTKIGTQWGSVTNVHWMFGDDYFGDKDTEFTACLSAMRSAGATQPVSIQNHQEMTSRTDIFNGDAKTWGRTNADFDWVYTYNPTYDGVEKAGLDNNTLDPIPYMWGDGLFLQSGTSGITVNQLMRRMVWWALSSGAKGVNIGNNIVYPWDTTAAWTEVQTNTWYTTTMGNIVDAFTALPNWHLLKADTSSQLVTAGRGTHATPRTSGGSGGQTLDDSDSYVTASYIQSGTEAGKLAVIYMSHGSTITIDESKLVAGYTAKWIDPASGATSSATTGTTYNSTAKGNNSDGQADWVLVLGELATLTSVTSTRATQWDTLARVTDTQATTWDTLAQVSDTQATTWDTLARTTSSRATSYDVLARVTDTQATTWDTLAGVSSTRATGWDTLAQVTDAQATSWDVLARVTDTQATTWDTLTQVSSTRATLWNVAGLLTQVTSSRSTTWDTLARVTDAQATTWAVLSALTQVTSSRATTWRTLAQVTDTQATTWDVLARTTDTKVATWDVLTVVSASSRSTTWDTLGQRTAARATVWRVLAQVTATRSTSWGVAPDPNALHFSLTAVADPPQFSVSADPPQFSARA